MCMDFLCAHFAKAQLQQTQTNFRFEKLNSLFFPLPQRILSVRMCECMCVYSFCVLCAVWCVPHANFPCEFTLACVKVIVSNFALSFGVGSSP